MPLAAGPGVLHYGTLSGTVPTRTESEFAVDPTLSIRNEILPPGTRVEVRRRFDGAWASGFEVAESLDDVYRLRRISDGSVLPTTFRANDVRQERKHRNMWWL